MSRIRFFQLCICLVLPLAALPSAAVRAAEQKKAAPTNEASVADSAFEVHEVESPYQRGPTKIRVLLPDKIQADKRYRCLYVLPVEAMEEHHYGDGLQECLRANIHNRYDLVCVAPTFSDLPWYADHPTNQLLRQESHFTEFVRPFVEERYPVLRSAHGRLLVGFSKSGWGAMSLLLRNPMLFGGAAAWDAPLMLAHSGKFGTGPIFGSQANFERYQISRLLAKHAKQLADGQRIVHFGYGNFRDHHQRAHRLMNQLGIRHVYADGPSRKHTWHSGWLPEAVERLTAEDE